MFEKNQLEKLVSPEKQNAWLNTLPCKILLGVISFKTTESLLYFHEKEMLKWGRLCKKLQKRKLGRNVVAYLVADKVLRSIAIKFKVAESKLSLLILKNNIVHVEKHSFEKLLHTYNYSAIKVIKSHYF